MAGSKLVCPKCKGDMQRGFLMDVTQAGTRVAEWVEGTPDAVWSGVRWRDKKRIEVSTYRCVNCGYLESYARP